MNLSFSRVSPLFFLIISAHAFASPQRPSHLPGTSGVIHFTGQIVESPCETAANIQHEQIAMSCYRDSTPVQQNISMSSLANTDVRLPGATVNLHYLDSQRKLAILNVNYD